MTTIDLLYDGSIHIPQANTRVLTGMCEGVCEDVCEDVCEGV